MNPYKTDQPAATRRETFGPASGHAPLPEEEKILGETASTVVLWAFRILWAALLIIGFLK